MSRNIRSLKDLQGGGRAPANDSGAESDGDDDRQGFFVGGSEHSGQEVLGPTGERNRQNLVQRLFDSAQQNGAELLTPEQLAAAAPQRARPVGGVRIGGPSGAASNDSDSDSADPEIGVYLYFWRNGFSIDDGPLRSFDDPNNREFLDAVMKGRIPKELEHLHRGKRIEVHMERKTTDYEQPKIKPFQGSGARLGNVVPSVVGAGSSTEPVQPANPPATQDDLAKALETAKIETKLDSSQPTTNIQIRLPNGQRLIGTFNHTHTISSLRIFVCTARQEMAFQPFQFMTTFPNKIIDDETLSLSDAGLLNAVVVVKSEA